ncbi:MAG TPA: hypothetical protein VN026_08400 [Bacteroidia bacterium]|jgi:hypothetical protein|nr:hypothetical protein [Bacteroidia bacterium]
MIKPKNIEIKDAHYLNISFDSTEGLNKFISFLLKSKIDGFGFEKSKGNTTYMAFFKDDEIIKIKEYLEYEKKD